MDSLELFITNTLYLYHPNRFSNAHQKQQSDISKKKMQMKNITLLWNRNQSASNFTLNATKLLISAFVILSYGTSIQLNTKIRYKLASNPHWSLRKWAAASRQCNCIQMRQTSRSDKGIDDWRFTCLDLDKTRTLLLCN